MTESRRAKLATALASPIGVLITLPLLVVAVGVSILLVGRDATRSASQSMAQKQLTEQASSITADVAFALDQAAPILERLRVLADPARPLDDVLVRMHDLIVGRPGVSYTSISFPDGTFRGAYLGEQRRIEAQESRVGARGTEVKRFTVNGGAIVPLREEITDYDPRKRGFYQLAQRHARARGPSRTRSSAATRPASRAPSRCTTRPATSPRCSPSTSTSARSRRLSRDPHSTRRERWCRRATA